MNHDNLPELGRVENRIKFQEREVAVQSPTENITKSADYPSSVSAKNSNNSSSNRRKLVQRQTENYEAAEESPKIDFLKSHQRRAQLNRDENESQILSDNSEEEDEKQQDEEALEAQN